jgi:phosphate starvation-inducible PhoH-like protein
MAKRRQREIKEKFQEEREHRVQPLLPKNEKQATYIRSILRSDQVVSVGCAGTGKTFISASIAADMLRTHRIKKIVLTRPNVAAGRSLGFFPGSLEEKIEPWVAPFTEILQHRLGANAYEIARKRKDIEVVPFEVMRGRTFNNAFVILDEAQNTTPQEIKMFLTRIGDGTKVLINGDIAQSDLKDSSGLQAIIHMIDRYKLKIPVIEFGPEDIVRSDICAQWIKAFNAEGI